MKGYSKDEIIDLAAIALAESEDHTGIAASIMRNMFPGLDLRSAVYLVRAARDRETK